MIVQKIEDQDMVSILKVFSNELVDKILKKDSFLLGLFAGEQELLSLAVVEQNNNDKVLVRFLFTLPEYRELGYAKMLLDSIKNMARKSNAKFLIVEFSGIAGEYEDIASYFEQVGFEKNTEHGNILFVKKDTLIDTLGFSNEEIEAELKNVKYLRDGYSELAKKNNNVRQFIYTNNISKSDTGCLAFYKEENLQGAVFLGDLNETVLKVKGIYIDKTLDQSEILMTFIVLLSRLEKIIKEKNLDLEITTNSQIMTGIIHKIFTGSISKKDHGYFIKEL